MSKINNIVVRPIPTFGGDREDARPIKGAALCPELYANIFITARKKSGKTTIIYTLLKHCVGRDTTVVIFSSTVHKDAGMKNIRAWLDRKDIPHIAHTSIMEDNANLLQALLSEMGQEEDEVLDETAEPQTGSGTRIVGMFGNEEEEEETAETPERRRSKYRAPEYIIILDDLSNELKNPALVKLLKENRHYRCKVIISSQYVLDLKPESRMQIDLWIIPGGQSEKKLLAIYKDSDCALEFEEFERIYRKATKKRYSFLWYDKNEQEFRINFNTKISQ